MQPLILNFDFSTAPPPGDPDGSQFRYDLSRCLERVLRETGTGRWRGGRYARGVVTIFLEVPDRRMALAQIQAELAPRELLGRMTVVPAES